VNFSISTSGDVTILYKTKLCLCNEANTVKIYFLTVKIKYHSFSPTLNRLGAPAGQNYPWLVPLLLRPFKSYFGCSGEALARKIYCLRRKLRL
jgi:hypothetical protein